MYLLGEFEGMLIPGKCCSMMPFGVYILIQFCLKVIPADYQYSEKIMILQPRHYSLANKMYT